MLWLKDFDIDFHAITVLCIENSTEFWIECQFSDVGFTAASGMNSLRENNA